MFGSRNSISTAGNEMRAMFDEAEQMLSEASVTTGEKADQLQRQGMKLLSSSISKAHELERIAISSVKDIAATTDTLVHENPWRSAAISGLIGAGIGIALGIAIARE